MDGVDLWPFSFILCKSYHLWNFEWRIKKKKICANLYWYFLAQYLIFFLSLHDIHKQNWPFWRGVYKAYMSEMDGILLSLGIMGNCKYSMLLLDYENAVPERIPPHQDCYPECNSVLPTRCTPEVLRYFCFFFNKSGGGRTNDGTENCSVLDSKWNPYSLCGRHDWYISSA